MIHYSQLFVLFNLKQVITCTFWSKVMGTNGESNGTKKQFDLSEVLRHKRDVLLPDQETKIAFCLYLMNGGGEVECWWKSDPECLGVSSIGGRKDDRDNPSKMFFSLPEEAEDKQRHPICWRCRQLMYKSAGIRAPYSIHHTIGHLYSAALSKKEEIEQSIKSIEAQIVRRQKEAENLERIQAKMSPAARERMARLQEEAAAADQDGEEGDAFVHKEEPHLTSHIRGAEELNHPR
tara:strand:- start:2455 stop:3159 length:705 start_codon:yes stop_codon:yes gene_type:complete